MRTTNNWLFLSSSTFISNKFPTTRQALIKIFAMQFVWFFLHTWFLHYWKIFVELTGILSLEKSNGAGSRKKREGLVEWHVWLAKLARLTKSRCCGCAYLQTPTGLREFENCSDGRPTTWTSSSSSMLKLLWRVLGLCKHNCRVWNLGIIIENVGPVARPWAHGQCFHVIATTMYRGWVYVNGM